MRTIFTFVILNCCALLCCAQADAHKTFRDSIELRYLRNGAFKQPLFSKERQRYIDSAIAVCPTDAYLWQQRGMPYFKCNKHQLGMKYLDRAVELDPVKWIDYRGFIKCIFTKDYPGAIRDLQRSIQIKKDAHIMDHAHDFYIGLCELQLEHYPEAAAAFKRSINQALTNQGPEAVHFMDEFYLGIAEYELENFKEAIACFDKCMKTYHDFADAEFYKAECLAKTGALEESGLLMKKAEADLALGRTFNEDNVIYEGYPYQVQAWFFGRKRSTR